MQPSSEFWTKVLFFHEGDEYFEEIEKSIRSAQEEVLIETYIFELDDMTLRLLNILSEFQQRDGRVQILVDGFGSYSWCDALQKYCSEHNLEFKVFRPLPRSKKWFRRLWLSVFFKFLFFLRGINRRNHRKTIIVDRKTAFLGSFN